VVKSPQYDSKWNDYRRRLRWLLCVGLGGFVLIATVGSILPPKYRELVCVVMGPWFVTSVVLMIRFAFFRCPRCGEHFFVNVHSMYGNPLAQRCVNCGLAKWGAVDRRDKARQGENDQ
jgi:hypothetical protein